MLYDVIPSLCQRMNSFIPASTASLLQIVQYGFPAVWGMLLLPSLINYNFEPFSFSGLFFNAFMIALCSAWMQQVLSVIFL